MKYSKKANLTSLMLFGKFIDFCIVIILLSHTCSFADTYYVSPNGSNSNNGSIGQPWLTVMHAVKNTTPGDEILLRGGVYPKQEEIWIRGKYGCGGQPGKWKTIKAFPGEIVKLSQRVIINADYIRIQGLHLSNGRTISVVEWDGPTNHVEILDNYLTGPYHVHSGAINYKGSYGLIQGNRLELRPTGGTTDQGIYIKSGSNNVVRNNCVSGGTAYCIHVYDENKYQKLGQYNPKIKNLLIENNIVTGSEERSGIIISAGESPSKAIEIDSVIIRNNIIVKNAHCGIRLSFYGKVRNVFIYNNVIYDNKWQVYIQANDADDIAIINNIFSHTFKKHILVENVKNIIISNNLYCEPQSIGIGATDAHAVFGDPLFIDATGNNFHLKEGSPAIDAGMDVGIPYIGAAPDIGAFEYSSKLNR